jgi:hypothetical protein
MACVPEAIPPGERAAHAALIGRLLSGSLERTPLDDGYALRFPAESFADVARFVENERRCCPFLTFQVTVARGEVALRLTGPSGTRTFLEAELSL